jgi:hypothetical protein
MKNKRIHGLTAFLKGIRFMGFVFLAAGLSAANPRRI